MGDEVIHLAGGELVEEVFPKWVVIVKSSHIAKEEATLGDGFVAVIIDVGFVDDIAFFVIDDVAFLVAFFFVEFLGDLAGDDFWVIRIGGEDEVGGGSSDGFIRRISGRAFL